MPFPEEAILSAQSETAQLTRRLDWRFLLPDPHLRRVVHLGPRASTLARALQTFSDTVAFCGAEEEPRIEPDLIVAEAATLQEVEAVLPRLGPRGWLYWELRPGHTLRPADLKRLGRCGVSQVQVFWHCGGFEDRRWIIPLDNPAGLAMLLKRRFTLLATRVLLEMARMLAHSRMVRRTLAISVIGRRAPAGRPITFPERFVEAHGGTFQLTAPDTSRAYVVATPTFPSSRCVVFLMDPGPSCEPTLVAKITRAEADDDPHAREAGNLRAAHLAHGSIEAPRLVAHAVFERHALLVETAVGGTMIRPRLVRSKPTACIEAVMRWLEDFHHATRAPEGDVPGRVQTLVESPLARLQSIVAHEPAGPELLAHVRRVTSRLDSLSVPLVFEHGDLSSPNLMMLTNGRAGVLDWELGEPRGLPAVDLFFFLAFIAFARERATTPEQCVAAFRGAFFGPTAWAQPYIARYAASVGVPKKALAPLFLLCWSRYLADLPERMAWAVGRDLRPDELADVRRDRYWHLWKYAAENVDELKYAF